MANFSTDSAGDVVSKAFASDTQQWPPGTGSSDKEVVPAGVCMHDGSLWQRVTTANPLPVTDAGVGGVGDAVVAAGATGSLSAKLRRISTDLAAAMTSLATLVSGIVGNVASGSADSGNPVKVGGRYNSTPPTLTNGQRGDLQLDASGSLKIAGTFSATPASTGSAPTTVSVGTSTTTILASNGNRRKMILINEGTVEVFIRYSASASTSNYNEKLQPGQRLEMDNVTAVVNGVVATGTCTVRPTEFTV